MFETILKRPDADYWIAFKYFDVYVIVPLLLNKNSRRYRDSSGTITYDEFKTVFSANLGPGSIPFDFDWCVSFPICFDTVPDLI